MASLDPTKLKDWEIAEASEATMLPVDTIADNLGLEKKELYPYGHYVGKLDYIGILDRLKNKKMMK